MEFEYDGPGCASASQVPRQLPVSAGVSLFRNCAVKPCVKALTSLHHRCRNRWNKRDSYRTQTPTPAPTCLPSSWPPSSWTEERSRTSLKNLCTVSRAFYAAAKPYVWRRAQIRLPCSWLLLVSEVTGGEDGVDELAMDLVKEALDVAARSVYAITARAKEPDHSTPSLIAHYV